MVNVYRVGVTIAMQNGVSSVLKVIQRDVLGLKHQVDLTQGSFNRLKLAAVGAGAVFAGGAMLMAFKGLAEAGGKLLNQQQLMLANGTTHADMAKEMATAYQMAAIAGSDIVQNLKMVADLRTVFGANNLGEAQQLAPTMMKAGIAAGLMTGQNAEQAAYNIAMIEDRLGYTINSKTGQMDPARAAQKANLIDAIISGTNGRVDTQQLLNFAQRALASGKLLSDQGLIDMVPVIQAMGGDVSGTALTAYDKAFVGGVMTQRGTGWLERLGLLNKSSVHKGQSGYSQIDPGAIAGSGIMSADPQAWANQFLIPALKKIVGPNGSLQDMLKVLAQSGLANTTVRFMSELVGSSVQNAKDVVNIQQAAGADQYGATMQGLAGATQNFTSAIDSLWDVLGLPAAQMAVTILNDLSGSIRSFTGWLDAHPEYASAIDKTLIGLGVGLTVLGGAAVTAAIAGMLFSGGTLAALGVAVTGVGAVLAATNWKTISKDFDGAVTTFEHGLQRLAYDLTHPAQLLKDAAAAVQPQLPPAPAGFHYQNFGRGGDRLVPDGMSPAGPGISAGQAASDAYKAIKDWIDKGAPVAVTNPGDIAKPSAAVALRNLHQGFSAPNSGPSGFNQLAGAPGSSARSGAN